MAKPDFPTKWESETYDKAFDAISVLLNLANSTLDSSSGKAVVAGMLDGFVQEHRTLQQSAVRNFVAMLKEWASHEESRMSDFRNQDAFAFAKQVVKLDPMFSNI